MLSPFCLGGVLGQVEFHIIANMSWMLTKITRNPRKACTVGGNSYNRIPEILWQSTVNTVADFFNGFLRAVYIKEKLNIPCAFLGKQ